MKLYHKITFAVILSTSSWASGQSALINYQGRLVENGMLVNSNNMSIILSLYDGTGTTAILLYKEVDTVTAVDGFFDTFLGDNPESAGVAYTNLPETLLANSDVWLGIRIAGNTELSPRNLLTAAPYAVTAVNRNGDTMRGQYLVDGNILITNNHSLKLAGVLNGQYAELRSEAVSGGAALLLGDDTGCAVMQYKDVLPGLCIRSLIDLQGYYITNATYHGDGSGITNILATASDAFIKKSGDTITGALSVKGNMSAGKFYNTNNAADGLESVAIGGIDNMATGRYATISGGSGNRAAIKAVVCGGIGNNASGASSSIGGGSANRAEGMVTVIGGGSNNKASGYCAAVLGGNQNCATGYASVVGGGFSNSAFGSYASVPGGYNNIANGNASLAAGCWARATNTCAFVWSDASDGEFCSKADNEFAVRAYGGIRFVTDESNPVTIQNGQIFASSFSGDGFNITNISANASDAFIKKTGDTITGSISIQSNLTVEGVTLFTYVPPQGGISMGSYTNR